jgi:anti-sigma B factor antagonist
MQLVAEDRPGARVVRVDEARIDAAVALEFKEAVRAAAGEAAPRIVLDLSAVSFLDSSGLGALVGAMKLLGPGRRLELSGLHPNLERVFALTRMDSVFRVHRDLGAALDGGPSPADAA